MNFEKRIRLAFRNRSLSFMSGMSNMVNQGTDTRCSVGDYRSPHLCVQPVYLFRSNYRKSDFRFSDYFKFVYCPMCALSCESLQDTSHPEKCMEPRPSKFHLRVNGTSVVFSGLRVLNNYVQFSYNQYDQVIGVSDKMKSLVEELHYNRGDRT